MFEVVNLRACHGPAEVVRGVSLRVSDAEVIAVMGPNGAGKTTLARAIAGLHRAKQGVVRLNGRDISRWSAVEVARAGVTLVPQGRRLFSSLTVAEHLTLASRHRRPRALSAEELLELFPQLGERLKVRARSLSGGEQQMLAIARAVVLGPDVLVMDEPTEGLAPSVVQLVSRLIAQLRARSVGILVLEQNRVFASDVADEVLAMDRGVIKDKDVPLGSHAFLAGPGEYAQVGLPNGRR